MPGVKTRLFCSSSIIVTAKRIQGEIDRRCFSSAERTLESTNAYGESKERYATWPLAPVNAKRLAASQWGVWGDFMGLATAHKRSTVCAPPQARVPLAAPKRIAFSIFTDMMSCPLLSCPVTAFSRLLIPDRPPSLQQLPESITYNEGPLLSYAFSVKVFHPIEPA